jgi:hypothetical protein
MTLETLYQLSGRLGLFLFGFCFAWVAIYWIVSALLKMDPMRHLLTRLRSAVFAPPFVAGALVGTVSMVLALRLPPQEFSHGYGLSLFGILTPLMALCCGIMLWQTGRDLRRTIIRRGQPHRANHRR